jgi:hypothetical protein
MSPNPPLGLGGTIVFNDHRVVDRNDVGPLCEIYDRRAVSLHDLAHEAICLGHGAFRIVHELGLHIVPAI